MTISRDLELSIKAGAVQTTVRYQKKSRAYHRKEVKHLEEVLGQYERKEAELTNDQYIQFMTDLDKHKKGIESCDKTIKEFSEYLKGQQQ